MSRGGSERRVAVASDPRDISVSFGVCNLGLDFNFLSQRLDERQ